MITFQNQLEPSVKLTWVHYKAPAEIDWLHSERRELISDEQVLPSERPREIPLSAIFNIDEYIWTEARW